MHRIDTPTAQKDKFGAGKNGFTRGNPQTGTPATDLDDDYFDMLQEELAGVVEATGVNLEKSKHNQLLTALKALLLSRANPFADIKADGAGAVSTALANLGIKSSSLIDIGEAIGDGKDLNSYNKPGFFYQMQDSQAASGVNYPENYAGSLIVYKNSGVTQVYRVYSTSRNYSRSFYGGVWSEWAQAYDTINPVPDATTARKGLVQLAGGAGSSSLLVMTQAAVTALNNTNIGKSQAVTDVTASRALGVTYTNSTGKPIAVGVAIKGGISLTTTAYVNGVSYCYDSSTATNASGNGVWFVVPDGMTYSVVSAQTTGTIIFWTELR